jgi:hypothetical protein
VSADLSAVHTARVATISTAVLTVATSGEGFFEITREIARFLEAIKAPTARYSFSSAIPRHRWSSRRMPTRMCAPIWSRR